jgi:integrator complex subunit 1
MAAVVHNQSLFQALVTCLKSTTDGFDFPVGASLSSSSAGARKRTHSIDLSNAITESSTSKSAKLALGQSPHAGKRPFNLITNQSTQQRQHQPQMNVRVTAATILFVALEPIDHWPVPLIEAYAEDSFGARSWVDDPVCLQFVQNLELVHKGGVDKTIDNVLINEDDIESEALAVAEFFRNSHEREQLPSTKIPATEEAQRRESLSSTASGDTMPPPPLLSMIRSISNGSESGVMQQRSSTSLKPRPKTRTFQTNGKDGSDSGEDAETTLALSKGNRFNNRDWSSSSSSSGEDEEVFMEELSVEGSEINHGDDCSEVSISKPELSALEQTYPVPPKVLKFFLVRQRFFGLNLDYAYHSITAKLSERLDFKSKQSSGLLHCLPSYTTIPGVRSLVTANLEKWLQSPALSGLARNLFSATVRNIRKVDPLLPADLESLDNILTMRVKSNQLNCHVENVTAVAARIPTAAVANHIYSYLLRETLQSTGLSDSSFPERVSMVQAVHEVLPRELQAAGIASSLVGILIKPPEAMENVTKSQLVRRISNLIRTLHKTLGKAFDPYEVMTAFSCTKVDASYSWTMTDEENKARLMFQCATLVVDTFETVPDKSVAGCMPSVGDIVPLQNLLRKCRKVILHWCCNEYAPICPRLTPQLNDNQKSHHSEEKSSEIGGAGPANYSSYLDGLDEQSIPDWINVIRCMLFMEPSSSVSLRQFLTPEGVSLDSDSDWAEEANRIDLFCDFGADVDDEIVWQVLKSATENGGPMPRETALLVLEHLFHCCRKDRKPRLLVKDPNLLWKLYELAEYFPSQTIIQRVSNENQTEEDVLTNGNTPERRIPRLGYSGMWWRTTVVALVICGASPEKVGTVAWEQHPTLAALIKMVTSDRYRFPTVDCDDMAREKQKKTEQSMRDEEAKITEQLFFSRRKPKVKLKQSSAPEISHQGSRASRRQQEKREKMWQKQREIESAYERAELIRQKKLLRAAQKSITVLDPKRGPRKPPKESAELIFSVGELFGLSRIFQKNTQPDFVLATIGSTSRSAIERAYDWLIPIISYLPDTISRLPASASCFLLLRAYGTQGEERFELQTLSAPLLQHVHYSLIGKFGKEDAVRAFELLFAELASHKPDRRRCARKVLQNAIGVEESAKRDSTFAGTNHSWVSSLTQVQHAELIVVEALTKLTTAATFEHGSNLRYLVLALRRLTYFAQNKGVTGSCEFAAFFIHLISRRPNVFALAFSSFSNLCSLAVTTIFEEYKIIIAESGRRSRTEDSVMVDISLCYNPSDENGNIPIKKSLSLSLLKASCVLLSIWCSEGKNEKEAAAIEGLVHMLLTPLDTSNGTEGSMTREMVGLASARLLDTDDSVVPVEFWVMLAKSRTDLIAKRSALTSPTNFLPRLLLCSGLPQASLLTMVDRLGRLGEKVSDVEKVFNELLIPSASSEWDIGRLGNRRELRRRLFGRISAYFRMYNISSLETAESTSLTFYKWLSQSCQPVDKSTKSKTKKARLNSAPLFENLDSATHLLFRMPKNSFDCLDNSSMVALDGNAAEMTVFLRLGSVNVVDYPPKGDEVEENQRFLNHVFQHNNPKLLDDWLNQHFVAPETFDKGRVRKQQTLAPPKPSLCHHVFAVLMLECYIQLERKVESLASIILSWVPRMSRSTGSPKLWKMLFAEGQKPSFFWENLLTRCLQCWTRNHICSCRSWLLSEGKVENVDVLRVVRFLFCVSTFRGIHTAFFADVPVASEDSGWVRSDEAVRVAAKFSLDCLEISDCGERLRSRNNLSDCLLLLLLIARVGRRQVHLIGDAIMERLPHQNELVQERLLLSLLRLYAYFPFSMNLGAASLRSNLTKAVEICADHWLSWRSPFDDTLQDVLRCVFGQGGGEVNAQMLVDTAKKHPLLLLRKLDRIILALVNDAMASNSGENAKEDTMIGQSLEGAVEAIVRGKPMTIQVKHWGYKYTESSWMLVLDVLVAVPQEVLLGCAWKMGLINLLNIYVRLIHIQSQLRTSGRLSMLKERFSVVLGEFKTSTCWESWLSSTMIEFPSLGAIRNSLTSCGIISHKEAMESIKKTNV